MTEWIDEYLLLALRIEKYLPGFVDAYYGPRRLLRIVRDEKKQRLEKLSESIDNLKGFVSELQDDLRRNFLTAQLTGMKVIVQTLMSSDIPFLQQVKKMYDVEPRRISDQSIAELHEALAEALRCGVKKLSYKLRSWKESKRLERKQISRFVNRIAAEARMRTERLLPLPPGNKIKFEFVKNRPWTGYNWYRGRYKSLVSINVDLPKYSVFLPYLVMHETYPGHHTESSIKEHTLYELNGYTESSIQVFGTPACVLTEGIAVVGWKFIFKDHYEVFAWCNEHLGTNLDLEKDGRIVQLLEDLELRGEAAQKYYVEGYNRKSVEHYLVNSGLKTVKEARKTVEFITNPIFGAYSITYSEGRRLLESIPEFEGIKKIRLLYTRQLTPSKLREGYLSQAASTDSN